MNCLENVPKYRISQSNLTFLVKSAIKYFLIPVVPPELTKVICKKMLRVKYTTHNPVVQF
jgi:hypothetical protein